MQVRQRELTAVPFTRVDVVNIAELRRLAQRHVPMDNSAHIADRLGILQSIAVYGPQACILVLWAEGSAVDSLPVVIRKVGMHQTDNAAGRSFHTEWFAPKPGAWQSAEGTCGSCLSTVLEGIPDHLDSFLSANERKSNCLVAVCVSKSMTPRLVLDW